AGTPAATPPAPLPAWLDPPAIGQRQEGIRERVEEIRARLAAFAEHKVEPVAGKEKEDEQHAKLLARVNVALPSVVEAGAARQRAQESLAARNAKPAIAEEDAALDALARAIEQFVDLKNLIELAYGQQKELVALLSDEAAKELEPAERARRTK